ncbi:TRAP transporter large permease [Agathobaculum sp. NTUH-O15-33]|uniref:TRAP transporter large permease n=1 Tax=Agathobaculum sp. NTUH-O15-33 TaxID=3079302 RepID=UPI00295899BD|nr:TRAP transporter large permease [Agathobaculum sp. NTUH-O15-33]WNX84119.1 TRAP transporter large permease [Agathobaculum sp. NTUH-O15-33]
MTQFLPILILFLLFAFNIPVGYCLLAAGLSYFVFLSPGMPMDMILQSLVAQSQSFTMLAIPLFVTAGVVMSYGGIAGAIMDFAEVLIGHRVGGLAQVNILTSTFMGGCSGSGNADTAFNAKIIVPEMEKRGYTKGFSAAVTTCSSCITPIIPPGICLIIYATAANQSIGDMFMAGYLPGLLIAAALMVVTDFISKRRGLKPSRDKRATGREVLAQLGRSIWALLLPLGIIMGLRLGVFTPTECGAFCIMLSAVVGALIYKKLKWSMVPKILVESAVTTACIMFILAGANMFARYLTLENIPQTLATAIMNFTDSPVVFLLIVNIFLILLGMFMDSAAALIILPPLLVPIATKLGIDPIHFGIIMCLNDTIGGASPPFGILLFTCVSIIKVKVSEYIREGWPLLLTLLACLLLITYVPGISLGLLRLFGS